MVGMKRLRAAVLSPKDDVATVLARVTIGEEVILASSDTGTTVERITAVGDIPIGHKIARRDIGSGEPVIKYSRPIGRTVRAIKRGEHVHSHNLISLSGTAEDTAPEVLIRPADWLKRTLVSLSEAGGMSSNGAANFADALWEANLRGVETHGVRRLEPYLERIAEGGVDPRAEPEIEHRAGLLLVDGNNGVGHHVAAVAADRAAELARETGVALALICNSNHFGFAGYYATRIAAKGCIGLATSNGQMMIAPPGGLEALFSNNPVAIAAPIEADEFLELDLATSVTSRAKIAMAAERGEPIVMGLATDAEGRDTTDARAAVEGNLLPMGGEKGFAFLFALEVLTGILSGGAYADQISSKEFAPSTPEKLSQLVAAIDIELCLGLDRFSRRLQDMIGRLKGSRLKADAPPVRYPGQRRWKLRNQRLKEGVPLAVDEYKQLLAVGLSYGLSLE